MKHQATIIDASEFRKMRLKERALTWAVSALVVLALLLIYAILRTNDEVISARTDLAQRKAVACPLELSGKQFVFSAYEHVSMNRPGTTRLSCWYKSGVKS